MSLFSRLFSERPNLPDKERELDWAQARELLRAEAARPWPRPPLQPRPKVVVQDGGATVTVFGTPPPDDPEYPTRAEVRRTLDVLREVYPTDLTGAVDAVGASLARAVIALEHHALDRGLAALLDLPPENPVVCYELARVAIALGLYDAAEAALRAFAAYAPGHRAIGGGAGSTHTATLLAELQTLRGICGSAGSTK